MSEETIPQMREQIAALEKQLKEANRTLASQATENRVLKARDVFGAQGFDPKAGELFAAQNPDGDITPEAVNAFVEAYGVGKAGAPSSQGDAADVDGGESDPAPAPGASDLAKLNRGGSRAGDGGSGGPSTQPMTRQEWQSLYAKDPAAAQAAVRQGRVQVSKDNVYVGEPTVGNPYAPRSE